MTGGREDASAIAVEAVTTAPPYRRQPMLMLILLSVPVLALIGAAPAWPYSQGWGYGPSGVLGTALLVLLILAVLGRI